MVSLPWGEVVPGEGAPDAVAALRAGGVSPADEMMRDWAPGYRGASGDDGREVFVVDVPLTEGGQFGLAWEDPGAGPGGSSTAPVRAVELPRTRVMAAGAALVAWMIRRAGFQPGRQVIQLLSAPPGSDAYGVFRTQAQEVADLVGADVYIVGAAGATVAYDAGREAFAARLADGGLAEWQWLSPSAPGEEAGQGQPPGYFGTDEHGILVRRMEAPDAFTALDAEAGGELLLTLLTTRGGSSRGRSNGHRVAGRLSMAR